MKTAANIHYFSYKSAFLFFVFILVFNLIFNPVLSMAGLGTKASLYVVNTLGISLGLTAVIIFVEGKFKNKKQGSLLFGSLLVVSAAVCYAVIYLS
ncbi:hypothetical protein [Bacillus sp. 1P06AnD]|uniref:hypothetical protein n=1 Tax=Bacillus sp. 1P06AnD TaxID=3132208 RepID=UPI0039A086BD